MELLTETVVAERTIRIGYTTKADGDLSPRGPSRHILTQRRRRLVARSWFAPAQVHSDRVIDLDNWQCSNHDARRSRRPPHRPGLVADALVTSSTETVVAVHTADCVPVGIYDPVTAVIAVIHAGWRGLLAGIIESTVRLMKGRRFTTLASTSSVPCQVLELSRHLHSEHGNVSSPVRDSPTSSSHRAELPATSAGSAEFDPSKGKVTPVEAPMVAVVGPHVGPLAYEFGAPELAAMTARFGGAVESRTSNGRPALDLAMVTSVALRRQGVVIENCAGVCTAALGDVFWSHRARQENGRMALVGWVEDVSKRQAAGD